MLRPMSQHNLNLLQLASLLDDAHARYESFEYGTEKTMQSDGVHYWLTVRRYDQGVFAHDCGTPACAIGHWAIERRNMPASAVVWHAQKIAADDFGITSRYEFARLFGEDGCANAQTAKEAAAFIREYAFERQANEVTP